MDVYCDPASLWWISPVRSVTPSRARVQMACSSASSTRLGAHGGGGPPAEDPPGVGVDDERDVDHPRPGRHVGEVGDPEPVRRRRVELALAPGRPAARAAASAIGGATRLPRRAPASPSSRISRSTVQRATGMPSRLSCQPHLAGAVDAVVLRVHPAISTFSCSSRSARARRLRRRGGRRSRSTGRSGSRARPARRRSARHPSAARRRCGRRARR